MPDVSRDDDDEGGMHDARGPAVTELVGRIGALFTKRRLSPPFDIRRAAGHWLGPLTRDEIIDVVEQHFERCSLMPGAHSSGSGDQQFRMLRAAMSKAIEQKHAWDAPAEAQRPQRKRKGRVRKLHHAGGVDVFDDRHNPDWIGEIEQPRPAPHENYRESGASIGKDVDPEWR